MNTTQKIWLSIVGAAVWIGSIVIAQLYPEVAAAMGKIEFASQSFVVSLGVYHLNNTPKV